MDDKEIEQAKEIVRQQDEAVKIGRTIRTVLGDMCRSRGVNYSIASGELMAHSLSMLRLFHKNVYDGIIKNGEGDGIDDFDSIFSRLALHEYLLAGEKISKKENNTPSIFGVLSEQDLTNENLAQCLFLTKGVAVESVSKNSFSAGREGDFFKIQISVHDDVISFFTYFDEPYSDNEKAAMDCARYNSKTNYSKAHIVNIDDYQIHFTYIYPHSGKIFVNDIVRVLLAFIDENRKETEAIEWGENE